MKTKQEQIKDLYEAATLLQEAYNLQNKAMCIIIDNYEIDMECKYLKNPFFLIQQCNTHSALYKAEYMCYELCVELNKQIKDELNK